ncbi:MAG: relaxase domain-containing protein [Actinobacteria bacterium]|nr:relaxase domain-containing protein [Actinomycetota bacterium]
MLTIRKIRVPSADWGRARRAADYVLDRGSSPAALLAPGEAPARPTAVWMGAPELLDRLGVAPAEAVAATGFGRVLQGRHASSGERVRTEGMIQVPLNDEHGHPLRDENGREIVQRVRGTKSVDLTFSAPKSVSVIWSQADRGLREEIEAAMLVATGAMLREMTERKPVVAYRRDLIPADGYAAAAALHVVARAAREEPMPWPQLHVHAVVVGVGRGDGFFASPELSGMYRYGAPLEGGAVARARLAEALVDLGFGIERRGRYFEVRGVPAGLIERMSGRAREVAKVVGEREAASGRRLTQRERAVVAMQTRRAKSRELPRSAAREGWGEAAEEFGFGPEAVAAMRDGDGFTADLRGRRAAVAAALGAVEEKESAGERRAAVFERAAGVLRLEEAESLLVV